VEDNVDEITEGLLHVKGTSFGVKRKVERVVRIDFTMMFFFYFSMNIFSSSRIAPIFTNDFLKDR